MITIGKISVPEQFIWAGIGIICALMMIYLLEKKWYNRSLASSIAYESVIFFVLVWKVSLLFFDPTLVFKTLSLVYFTGGSYGFVMAIFLSVGYVGWKISKLHERRNILFLLVIAIELTSIIIAGCSWLYNDKSILFMLLHALLLGLLLFTKRSQWLFLDLFLWGGILSIILEFYIGVPIFLGLSDWQWINLITGGCAAFILLYLHMRRSYE